MKTVSADGVALLEHVGRHGMEQKILYEPGLDLCPDVVN